VLVDPLSVMMMLIVSGVGALIVMYSIGYMHDDVEERRYFAYMSLFVFSMLLLVQGGNLLLLLAGWGIRKARVRSAQCRGGLPRRGASKTWGRGVLIRAGPTGT
jgi:uncharacterized membrane protein